MHSLNASLRLTHYNENNQAFSTSAELLEHLQAEVAEHRLPLEDIARDGEIATGYRLLSMHAASNHILTFWCFYERYMRDNSISNIVIGARISFWCQYSNNICDMTLNSVECSLLFSSNVQE